MALVIKQGRNELYKTTWHVGEELPKIEGRVVQFTADGDELAALLRGLGYEGEITGERFLVDSEGKEKPIHQVRSTSEHVPPFKCDGKNCKVCAAKQDNEDTIPGDKPAYGTAFSITPVSNLYDNPPLIISCAGMTKTLAPFFPEWLVAREVFYGDSRREKDTKFLLYTTDNPSYPRIYELFLKDTSLAEM